MVRIFYLSIDDEDPDIREIKPEWYLNLTRVLE
jgi:hypothetical protein